MMSLESSVPFNASGHGDSVKTAKQLIVCPPLHCSSEGDDYLGVVGRRNGNEEIEARFGSVLCFKTSNALLEEQCDDTEVDVISNTERRSVRNAWRYILRRRPIPLPRP